MKTKNFSKKLVLRKETVSNLDTSNMYNIKGGADSDPGSTCKHCPTVGTLCLPSTQCPPDPTYISACDCISVDLACPTDANYNTCNGGFTC